MFRDLDLYLVDNAFSPAAAAIYKKIHVSNYAIARVLLAIAFLLALWACMYVPATIKTILLFNAVLRVGWATVIVLVSIEAFVFSWKQYRDWREGNLRPYLDLRDGRCYQVNVRRYCLTMFLFANAHVLLGLTSHMTADDKILYAAFAVEMLGLYFLATPPQERIRETERRTVNA